MTEIINAEIATPLSIAEAQRLDSRIRLLVGQINDTFAKLTELVEQAKSGDIYQVLGYPSWTAYISDVFTVTVRLDRAQRRELVGYLSHEGMSQRAIADVVGADRKTVRSDLAQVGEFPPPDDDDDVDHQDLRTGLNGLVADGLLHPDDAAHFAAQARGRTVPRVGQFHGVAGGNPDPRGAGEITGRDGKQYPSAPPVPAKPRRQPLTDAFWRTKLDIKKVIERAGRLVDDERFHANRDTISSTNRADLIRARDELNRVIDRMGGDC